MTLTVCMLLTPPLPTAALLADLYWTQKLTYALGSFSAVATDVRVPPDVVPRLF